MKTINLKIYSINELTERAKQRAIADYKENDGEIFWSDEILQSLKSLFENCNNIKLKDYSLGKYNSHIKIEFDRDEIEELQGKRAIAWLENNLISDLRVSYTSQKRKELRKYGNYYYAGMIKPCAFTGVCFDDDFLYSLIKDVKEGMTLKDAFNALADTYEKILNDEITGQNTEEYITEHMDANGYEFLENGERY